MYKVTILRFAILLIQNDIFILLGIIFNRIHIYISNLMITVLRIPVRSAESSREYSPMQHVKYCNKSKLAITSSRLSVQA